MAGIRTVSYTHLDVYKRQVVNYLKNLTTLPLPQQQAWADFEKNLYSDRLRQKYENLIRLSSYVTKAESEREYMAQNTKASLRYLYVPCLLYTSRCV